MLETIISYDEQLLQWFNQLPIGKELVAIAAELHWILVAILLVAWWLVGTFKKDASKKDASLHIFWSICLGFFVAFALNQVLPMRPRPEDVAGVNFLLEHTPDNSFPSTHAIFAGTSVMTIRWLFSRPVTFVFFATAIVMCLARIVAGIHFPTDIVAGLIIGFGVGFIHWMISDWGVYKAYALELPKKIASFIRL